MMKEKLNQHLQRTTLRQLRALMRVVETGTISGAAKAIHVTPPAVALQMRQLEEAAGMPLIERGEAGMRPTEAGREILAAAQRIEAILAECSEALKALSGAEGGQVSVGVISTAKYFAPRALAAFSNSYPKVEMRLQIGNREATIAALKNHDLDFAIMGRPPEDFEVENAVIGDHPHIIIGPPDHPLARRRKVALAELAEETFLLREQGSGTRLLMRRLFADEALEPKSGMEIGSNETIKQAVIAGLGIALISAHTVAAEIQDGRLAALNVVGLPVVRQWFVVRHREKRLLPAAQALWDFLATSGVQFLPSLPSKER